MTTPYAHPQYIPGNLQELGQTVFDTITLSDSGPTDHVVWLGRINPGFNGTIRNMVANFGIYQMQAAAGPRSTTLKIDINPKGLAWENLFTETHAWDTAAGDHLILNDVFAAADLTNANVPFDIRISLSSAGVDTWSFVFYGNNTATGHESWVKIYGDTE